MKKCFSAILLVTLLLCPLILFGCKDPVLLQSPQNLRIEERLLTWDEVEGAQGYEVYYQHEVHTTTACEYRLSDLLVPDYYEIEVRAVGDWRQYADSEWAVIEYEATAPITQGLDERGFLYTLMEDGASYELTRPTKVSALTGDIVVPSHFDGLPVKQIGNNAFKYSQYVADPFRDSNNNTFTTSVTLPDTVEIIGAGAFEGVIYMTEIVLPDSVKELGTWAFRGCKNLRRVTFPKGLKVIPEYCFAWCGLEEINFPPELEVIEAFAFSAYYDIGDGRYVDQYFTEVVFPDSIKKIKGSAFCLCKRLTKIVLPENYLDIYIQHSTFEYTGWYDALPEGVVSIGEMFYGYKGDMGEEYTIPSQYKVIAAHAFESKSNLKRVIVPKSIQRITIGPLPTFRRQESVFYEGSQEEWDALGTPKEWRSLGSKTTLYLYSETKPTQEGNYWHYVNGVATVWE